MYNIEHLYYHYHYKELAQVTIEAKKSHDLPSAEKLVVYPESLRAREPTLGSPV